ncbi:MAG: hypothetical protein IPO86_08540 [Saprospiraceae bacterium]|nr:hypothetical protein [Saprospiraceae bacterium]
MAYEYLKQKDNLFVFSTKNENDYLVFFKFSDEYFTHTCTHCKNIFEIYVNCINNENPVFDLQTMETVMEIIEDFTKDGTVAAVMYKCYDGDGRGCKREAHFERTFENSELNNFEYYSHTYLFEDEKGKIELRYNLLAATDNENYSEIVDDFYDAPNYWFNNSTEIRDEEE